MKKLLYTFLFVLIQAAIYAQANNATMIINTDARIDSTGNAIYEMSGKLTAQQWINWNYMYGGGNASNVKRTIERTLSPYYVYDFKYMPNEMERSFVIQYKAKGIIEYLGKDKWVASLGLKDAQPVKLTENTFNLVASQLGGNGIVMQNNMRVTLPVSVTNMEFDKDEFGNILVKYKMPTDNKVTLGDPKIEMAGYSLLGMGVLTLLAIVVFRKKLS